MVGLLDSTLRCIEGVMNSYRCPWALATTGLAGLEVIQSRAAYRCSGSCLPFVLGADLAETCLSQLGCRVVHVFSLHPLARAYVSSHKVSGPTPVQPTDSMVYPASVPPARCQPLLVDLRRYVGLLSFVAGWWLSLLPERQSTVGELGHGKPVAIRYVQQRHCLQQHRLIHRLKCQ